MSCGWRSVVDDSPCSKAVGHAEPHVVRSPYGDGRLRRFDVETSELLERSGGWPESDVCACGQPGDHVCRRDGGTDPIHEPWGNTVGLNTWTHAVSRLFCLQHPVTLVWHRVGDCHGVGDPCDLQHDDLCAVCRTPVEVRKGRLRHADRAAARRWLAQQRADTSRSIELQGHEATLRPVLVGAAEGLGVPAEPESEDDRCPVTQGGVRCDRVRAHYPVDGRLGTPHRFPEPEPAPEPAPDPAMPAQLEAPAGPPWALLLVDSAVAATQPGNHVTAKLDASSSWPPAGAARVVDGVRIDSRDFVLCADGTIRQPSDGEWEVVDGNATTSPFVRVMSGATWADTMWQRVTSPEMPTLDGEPMPMLAHFGITGHFVTKPEKGRPDVCGATAPALAIRSVELGGVTCVRDVFHPMPHRAENGMTWQPRAEPAGPHTDELPSHLVAADPGLEGGRPFVDMQHQAVGDNARCSTPRPPESSEGLADAKPTVTSEGWSPVEHRLQDVMRAVDLAGFDSVEGEDRLRACTVHLLGGLIAAGWTPPSLSPDNELASADVVETAALAAARLMGQARTTMHVACCAGWARCHACRSDTCPGIDDGGTSCTARSEPACGRQNPDYPELRCTFPAGHGLVPPEGIDDHDGYDHGDPQAGAWWSETIGEPGWPFDREGLPAALPLTADGQVLLDTDGDPVAMAASRSWAEAIARLTETPRGLRRALDDQRQVAQLQAELRTAVDRAEAAERLLEAGSDTLALEAQAVLAAAAQHRGLRRALDDARQALVRDEQLDAVGRVRLTAFVSRLRDEHGAL